MLDPFSDRKLQHMSALIKTECSFLFFYFFVKITSLPSRRPWLLQPRPSRHSRAFLNPRFCVLVSSSAFNPFECAAPAKSLLHKAESDRWKRSDPSALSPFCTEYLKSGSSAQVGSHVYLEKRPPPPRSPPLMNKLHGYFC